MSSQKGVEIKKAIYHPYANKCSVDGFAPNLVQLQGSPTESPVTDFWQSVEGCRFYGEGANLAIAD